MSLFDDIKETITHPSRKLRPKVSTEETMAKKAITLVPSGPDTKQPYCLVGSEKIYAVTLGQLRKVAAIPQAVEALYPTLAATLKANGWTAVDAVQECTKLFGGMAKKAPKGAKPLTEEQKAVNKSVRTLAAFMASLAPHKDPEDLQLLAGSLIINHSEAAIAYLKGKTRGKDGYFKMRNK